MVQLATGDIIGSLALALNLFTLLFIFGFWKGKVDTRLDLLWKLSVENVLFQQTQKGFIAPGSDFRPTEALKKIVQEKGKPEIMELLRGLALRSHQWDDTRLFQEVAQEIGMERITQRCRELNMTPFEFLGNSIALVREYQNAGPLRKL